MATVQTHGNEFLNVEEPKLEPPFLPFFLLNINIYIYMHGGYQMVIFYFIFALEHVRPTGGSHWPTAPATIH